MSVNPLSNQFVIYTGSSCTDVDSNAINFYDFMYRNQGDNKSSSPLVDNDISSSIKQDFCATPQDESVCSSGLNLHDACYSNYAHEVDVLQCQLGLSERGEMSELSRQESIFVDIGTPRNESVDKVEVATLSFSVTNVTMDSLSVVCDFTHRVDVAMLSIATGHLAYGFLAQMPNVFLDLKYTAFPPLQLKECCSTISASSVPVVSAEFDASILFYAPNIQVNFSSGYSSAALNSYDDNIIYEPKAGQVIVNFFLNKIQARKMTLVSAGEYSTLYVRDYFNNNQSGCLFVFEKGGYESVRIGKVVINGFLIDNVKGG